MTERYDIAAFRARPDGLGGHARTGVSTSRTTPNGDGLLRSIEVRRRPGVLLPACLVLAPIH